MKYFIFFLSIFMLSGCGFFKNGHTSDADGLSKGHAITATTLGKEAADQFAKRYEAASTPINLECEEGYFCTSFEHSLRNHGFAVGNDENMESVSVNSITDVFYEENIYYAYAEIRTSDGKFFSLLKKLKAPTVYTTEFVPPKDIQNASYDVPTASVVNTVVDTPATQPLTSASPQVFILSRGSLYAQLNLWAEKNGYQLVWKSKKDLQINNKATFVGTFEETVEALFASLTQIGRTFSITFYEGNKVLKVEEE